MAEESSGSVEEIVLVVPRTCEEEDKELQVSAVTPSGSDGASMSQKGQVDRQCTSSFLQR